VAGTGSLETARPLDLRNKRRERGSCIPPMLLLRVPACVVGATVVGATVVGATVVGATVVGATVVGATAWPGSGLNLPHRRNAASRLHGPPAGNSKIEVRGRLPSQASFLRGPVLAYHRNVLSRTRGYYHGKATQAVSDSRRIQRPCCCPPGRRASQLPRPPG